MTTLIHPWEKAGLGAAPFRFIGMTEKVYRPTPELIMPGGTCAYCSNGIRYVFECESADGKRFGVGCDCIRKVHHEGEKIVTAAMRAERDAKRKQRAERDGARIAAARALLAGRPELFRDRPHPYQWQADK